MTAVDDLPRTYPGAAIDSPGARDLHAIRELLERAAARIATWTARHGAGCRCRCCREFASPMLARQLAAAATVAEMAAVLIECNIPE